MQYAISDIHGCSATFRYLVEQKLQLKPSDELFLLGDYIDRGPDSKGVLDYIMELQVSGYQVKCLRGNHEQMLLDGKNDLNEYRNWLQVGGLQTAKSFGALRHMREIDEKYWNFLENLDYYFTVDNFYLVHAGFNFHQEDFLADKEKMLWVRYWYEYLSAENWDGKTIVHGHTPVGKAKIEDMLTAAQPLMYLNIDAGCCFKYPTMGNLCALNLTHLELTFQSCID